MPTDSDAPGPIFTAHLFENLDRLLIQVLESLTPEEWEAPTLAGKWKVKDVAAHLLDTQLRRLSICRDEYTSKIEEASARQSLVDAINQANEEGVTVYRRLSSEILISLSQSMLTPYSDYLKGLDPLKPARFAVSWAGEKESANWFDIAREFTERWHHQQQIRLAVDKPGIMTRELYHPVLDCFMRALPYRYTNIARASGSVAQFEIAGECGGTWYLQRIDDAWKLRKRPASEPISTITIPQEIAWRIFTKGIAPSTARQSAKVSGDEELAIHLLGMISIVG